jgi:hypothetical protein
MECAIDQVIKSMVVLDKYPQALAQLAQLHKIPQDGMVRLACRKNRAEHLAYTRDAAGNAVLCRDLAYTRNADGNVVLWRDFAQENDETHHIEYNELGLAYTTLEGRYRDLSRLNVALIDEVRRLQGQIKEARDGEEDALGINEQAKVYLTKARTKAGRAEFAAATAECTRAEQHSKDTHALISAALEVLDMA